MSEKKKLTALWPTYLYQTDDKFFDSHVRLYCITLYVRIWVSYLLIYVTYLQFYPHTQILFSKPEQDYHNISLNCLKETAFALSEFKWKKRASSPGSGSVQIKHLSVLETDYPLANIPIKLGRNTSTASLTQE